MELKDILEEGHIHMYDHLLVEIEKLYKEENKFYPVFGLFLRSSNEDPTPAFTLLNLPDDYGNMLNSQEGKSMLNEYFKYQIQSIKDINDGYDPCGFLMITEVWKTKLPTEINMEEFRKLNSEEQYKLAQEEGVKSESLYVVLNTDKGDMTADYDVIRDGDAFVRSSEPEVTFFDKEQGGLIMNKFKYF